MPVRPGAPPQVSEASHIHSSRSVPASRAQAQWWLAGLLLVLAGLFALPGMASAVSSSGPPCFTGSCPLPCQHQPTPLLCRLRPFHCPVGGRRQWPARADRRARIAGQEASSATSIQDRQCLHFTAVPGLPAAGRCGWELHGCPCPAPVARCHPATVFFLRSGSAPASWPGTAPGLNPGTETDRQQAGTGLRKAAIPPVTHRTQRTRSDAAAPRYSHFSNLPPTGCSGRPPVLSCE